MGLQRAELSIAEYIAYLRHSSGDNSPGPRQSHLKDLAGPWIQPSIAWSCASHSRVASRSRLQERYAVVQ